MKYFKGVETIEELKKAYRKMAMKHHPDRGGDTKTFVEIKDEYEKMFESLKSEKEVHGAYAKIIDDLMKFDLEIEIIGTWVWVSGDTKPVKESMKEMGFKYSGNKKSWYWYEGEFKKRSKKKFTMEEIRDMHGSQSVKKRNGKAERKEIGA
jgi:curved DNA-binding protein CbpA